MLTPFLSLTLSFSWEATVHLREVLGESYTFCTENVFVSLWKNFNSCQVSIFFPSLFHSVFNSFSY